MDNPHDNRRYIAAQRDRSDEIVDLKRKLFIAECWIAFLVGIVLWVIASTLTPLAAHAQTIDAKYLQAESYILSVNPCAKDSALAAKYLVDASREAQLGWGWRLLASISRYETGEKFCVTARGKAGERGLLQILPSEHKADFAPAGLDWDDPYDQVLFGAAVMLAISERKGYTLHRALEPWSVRECAIKEYRRIR